MDEEILKLKQIVVNLQKALESHARAIDSLGRAFGWEYVSDLDLWVDKTKLKGLMDNPRGDNDKTDSTVG